MILELQQWGAPPVLMLLILLLNFNAAIDHRQDVQFCEVFAGQGEVTKSLRALGLRGTCHDISYSHEYMDLTSTVGFLLVLNELRRTVPGAICVFALCCNSFCRMSRSSSGRHVLFPLGFEDRAFVAQGNLLASRLMLFLYLCNSRGVIWVVEQPEGSAFSLLPRWKEFIEYTTVFTTSFWMGAFQGPTAKRHRLWSNSRSLLQGIFQHGGYMSRAAMQALPGGPLVKKV
ncbi:unnamed protein product [Durusdinium trenchii]|uniref:Uncharacterized protein n=1 Tax=Durusdinium trenchii TaxID=1381693 RepID=A0ABP0R9H9_9DINO